MPARRLGPLPVACALALAPALDRGAVPASARWVLAIAMAVGARRVRRLVVPAIVALGAARAARGPAVAPAGAIADDRIADRVVGVVEPPVVRTPHGSA